MKFKLFILTLSLCFNNRIFPQQSKLSKAVNYLSGYISSQHFSELKKTNSDLALMDSIYLCALKYEDYNYSEALLALTFTTVPYREVPIVIPLLKDLVDYPLTSATDSVFLLKNKNLPKNLLFDSPQNNYGDKDKNAHFFGSAFLSYSTMFLDLSKLIGYFVEVFEQDFIPVGGKIDYRDLYVDVLGEYFGKILKKDKSILPSQIFAIVTADYLKYQFP